MSELVFQKNGKFIRRAVNFYENEFYAETRGDANERALHCGFRKMVLPTLSGRPHIIYFMKSCPSLATLMEFYGIEYKYGKTYLNGFRLSKEMADTDGSAKNLVDVGQPIHVLMDIN